MSGPSTSRRCRIQARPNIGIPRPLDQALAKQRPRTLSESKHHENAKRDTKTTHDPIKTHNVVETLADNQHAPTESVNDDQNMEDNVSTSTAALSETLPHAPAKTSFVIANADVQLKTDEPDEPRSATQRRTTSSSTTSRHRSTSKSGPSSKKKKLTGEEQFDPKTMTMYDMIFWNPNNETKMKSMYMDGDKKTNPEDRTVAEWEKVQDEEKRKAEAAKAAQKVAAPQVKIAADGSLIVDESSLTVVHDTSSSIWETVNEGGTGHRVTSTSFRKKAWRKGTAWSELETELFYDILRATGPDFGLMHEFFPSRARAELKSKFNREERSHWDRISKAMAVPTELSESLFEHAKEVLERIGQETLKKKEKRMSKKMKALQHAEKEEDEASEQDEGPSEKEVKIKVVKPATKKPRKKPGNKEKPPGGTPRKRAKKRENFKSKEEIEEYEESPDDDESTTESTEQDPPTSAIFDNLGCDFPQFKMVEEADAEGVSFGKRNDGMPPVVKVPLNTKLTAYPEDKARPERIVFICPAKNSYPPTEFLIQQRIAVADPPSGFLHLFGPSK